MGNFQKIIDQLSEALDILDFSFIISGLLTFSGIMVMLTTFGNYVIETSALYVFFYLLMSYFCGLISWSVGRFFRINLMRHSRFFGEFFDETINYINHKLDSDTIIKIGTLKEKETAYSYMWLCLREEDSGVKSFNLANRFWVMQALFEGLTFSALIWTIYSILYIINNVNTICWKVLLISLAVLFYLVISKRFLEDAKRYAEFQIKEVVLWYIRYKSK